MPRPRKIKTAAPKKGESPRETMLRLRREQPEKFARTGRQAKKYWTAEQVESEKQKAVEKALAEIKPPAPAPSPAPPKVSSTPPVEIKTEVPRPPVPAPAPVTPPAPAPAPVTPPAPAPAPVTPPAEPQIVSEAELFSPVTPPEQSAPGSGPELPPVPEQTPPGAAPPAGDGKRYAVMIWGAIVKIFCGIFGEGFQPMVLKSETGEVLYDENVEGIKVWLNYLASIGVKAFSPVVELWLFMSMYVGLRFPLILAKFRRKKPATTSAGGPPSGETPPKEPAPAPARPAAPPQKTEPAPGAAPKIELAEVEEADFR